MQRREFGYVISLLLLVCAGRALANEVTTALSKDAGQHWSVTYTAEKPVTRLAFARSPDDSRTRRWQPFTDAFVVRYFDGQEYIERTDGAAFTSVSLHLTPTYIPLPKDYAPFSPFSDGGMLLHSGRFFACAEACDSATQTWAFTLSVPANESIIVSGKGYQETAGWEDTDSGQTVYVGTANPIADSHFVSIIDQQLPAELSQLIAAKLPELMAKFAAQLGELAFRPTLFASYSDTDDGRYGHQGGVLPGQVFMHWYGKPAIAQLDSQAVYWFFAHEVAHLFQREAAQIEIPADAWVHEGVAEFFAGQMADKGYFGDKLVQAKLRCRQGLQGFNDYAQASQRNSQLHYSCGVVLMNAINADLLATSDKTLFDVWKAFNASVMAGATPSAQSFVATLRPYLSAPMQARIEDFATRGRIDWLME